MIKLLHNCEDHDHCHFDLSINVDNKREIRMNSHSREPGNKALYRTGTFRLSHKGRFFLADSSWLLNTDSAISYRSENIKHMRTATTIVTYVTLPTLCNHIKRIKCNSSCNVRPSMANN